MARTQVNFTLQPTWKHWFVNQVGHKFRSRAVEWLAAFQMTGLGLVLLHPGETFKLSNSYTAMEMWGSESQWALLLTLCGISGLVGLFANGSMESVTPWIRAIRALIGALVFSMIASGLLISWLVYGNPPSTGLPMYWGVVVAEMSSIYNAITDARVYRNGRRDNRNPSASNR